VLLGEIPERRRERYFQQLSQEERLLPTAGENAFGTYPASPVAAAERRRRVGLYRRRRSDGASRGKITATCWTAP